MIDASPTPNGAGEGAAESDLGGVAFHSAPGAPSYQSTQRRKPTRASSIRRKAAAAGHFFPTDQALARIFAYMLDRHSQSWADRYGNPAGADLWRAALAGLTWRQIRAGLIVCLSSAANEPPTPEQFRQYCRPPRNYFGRTAEQLARGAAEIGKCKALLARVMQ